MSNYIYGASVQGIQSFIFQTNKLKEIVGASQLVDDICRDGFIEFCNSFDHSVKDENLIMKAAGNIRYLVDEETCQKIVRGYPQYVINYAPGITLSQAVVAIKGNLKKAKKILEQRLNTQKNRVVMPANIGFMGVERARRTGGVAFDFDKDGKHQDKGTSQKIKSAEKNHKGLFKKFKEDKIKISQIPLNVDKITADSENAWLAIIHADGNGLGLVLRNLLDGISDNEEVKKVLADFSDNLELATTSAAQIAINAIAASDKEKKQYLFRPVVLGGDDLTLIIRADLAYQFTKKYLEAFEEQTQKLIGSKLTACAGIAYVKKNYPFHYGAHLAESLTSQTKKILKNLNGGKAPSALNFYKVQASFIEELSAMKKRTHYAKAAKVSFDYGPYLIFEKDHIEGIPHISELKKGLNGLKNLSEEEANGVAKLREWSAELHLSEEKATFMKNRMKQMNADFYEKLNVENILESIKTTNENDKTQFALKVDQEKFGKNEKEVFNYKYKSKVNDLIALSSFKSPDKNSK